MELFRVEETDGIWVRSCLREPDPQANKGDLGRLLLVCGSYGMAGACILAARAALRCGVGLLEAAVDARIYPIVAQAVPEAVFLPLDWEKEPQDSIEKLKEAINRCTACLMGCGLGALSETVCPIVLESCRAPLLIDADGLNFLARHPGALENVSVPFVLTPHPGEMSRLCGKPIPEIQKSRVETARSFAGQAGGVVVLKGAGTVTADETGRCRINPTGNPGMATGGSGDVLAGMISSLLAQGTPCFEAAAAGAYLHGLAGDLCARRMGTRAMLPSDLIEALPEAFAFEGK